MSDIEDIKEGVDKFNTILDAVHSAANLKNSHTTIYRVTQGITKQINEVETVKLGDEAPPKVKHLLESLKQKLVNVSSSASTVQELLMQFGESSHVFQSCVQNIKQSKRIPPDMLKEFIRDLKDVYEKSKKSIQAFNQFLQHLDDCKDDASQLTAELKKLEINATEAAETRENMKYVAGTAAVALGVVSFFTFGATAPFAIAAAGAAGAAGVGIWAGYSESSLRDLGQKFSDEASKLDTIARELTGLSEKAHGIQLSEKSIKAIGIALEHYRMEQEKNREMEAKDRRIAELEAKLAQQASLK